MSVALVLREDPRSRPDRRAPRSRLTSRLSRLTWGASAAPLVALALALAACGHAPPARRAGPPPVLPDAKHARSGPAPLAEWYWETIAVTPRPGQRTFDPPVSDAKIVRTAGAERYWSDLRPEGRERLRRDGLVVVAGDVATERARPRSLADFYEELRTERVPYVVTLDALFTLTNGAIARALAEVEETELAPALDAFLARMDTRLDAEQAGAGIELRQAYAFARGVVAVARSLATPSWVPPKDLAPIVAAERARIDAHAGQSPSPLLGVPFDYSCFVVPASAGRPGSFRAMAWLGRASFAIVARSEEPDASVSVYEARRNARAAMLLARLVDRDVDPVMSGLYAKITRVLGFLWGPPDDVSLTDLDARADAASVDLTKPESIANVARVDRVRSSLRARHAPAIYDGSGAPFRAGLAVRLFGGHAPVDSLVLQGLLGAAVGTPRPGVDTEHVRGGLRVLPSAYDLAAWLGAPEAKNILRETSLDLFEKYDTALAAAVQARPPEDPSRHASVYGSYLDALAAWADPSNAAPAIAAPPAARARIESLLAAWSLARHAGRPFARPKPPVALARAKTPELEVAAEGVPVFVEAAPDVIARLLGTVRQTRRGLAALGMLAPTTRGHALLVEIEDVLTNALHAAERLAAGDALAKPEEAALASLPARLRALEEAGVTVALPAFAVAGDDPAGRRAVVSAALGFEPALMLVQDPSLATDTATLAVGAHLVHREIVVVDSEPGPGDRGSSAGPQSSTVPSSGGNAATPRGDRTDEAFRVRLASSPRPAWLASFRTTATSARSPAGTPPPIKPSPPRR